MYSFGPLPRQKKSGRIIGTHQKIDRIARRHLATLLGDDTSFPGIADILHFEGSRGPDGVKLKSPGRDEPWHFIDPASPSDSPLLRDIDDHRHNLTMALRADDRVRAAYEAAWLAHAITDGLTPAHHDAFDDQLAAIGHNREDRLRVRDKFVIKGASRRDMVRNNWRYWGAKGIMTTHTLFEAGVAVASKPYKFASNVPSTYDITQAKQHGYEASYLRFVSEIAALNMYEEFKRTGWTNKLALQTNRELLPRIIVAVTLAWYLAAEDAKR